MPRPLPGRPGLPLCGYAPYSPCPMDLIGGPAASVDHDTLRPGCSAPYLADRVCCEATLVKMCRLLRRFLRRTRGPLPGPTWRAQTKAPKLQVLVPCTWSSGPAAPARVTYVPLVTSVRPVPLLRRTANSPLPVDLVVRARLPRWIMARCGPMPCVPLVTSVRPVPLLRRTANAPLPVDLVVRARCRGGSWHVAARCPLCRGPCRPGPLLRWIMTRCGPPCPLPVDLVVQTA